MVVLSRNLVGATFVVAGFIGFLLAAGNQIPTRLVILGLAFVFVGLVIFASTSLLQRDSGSWMSQGRPPP